MSNQTRRSMANLNRTIREARRRAYHAKVAAEARRQQRRAEEEASQVDPDYTDNDPVLWPEDEACRGG